jgi:hypothetical protein
MRRQSSTVVVVVGDGATEVVSQLTGLRNVHAIVRGGRTPEAVEAQVAASSSTYVVHEVDPLAAVGDAWVELFDGGGPVGRLEVAIEAAVAALGTDRAVLPDYYAVLEPDVLPVTRRHWWLGAVAGLAPSRVLPLPRPATAATLAHELGHLPAGRWWPDDLATRLRALPHTVPDRAGLTPEAERPA